MIVVKGKDGNVRYTTDDVVFEEKKRGDIICYVPVQSLQLEEFEKKYDKHEVKLCAGEIFVHDMLGDVSKQVYSCKHSKWVLALEPEDIIEVQECGKKAFSCRMSEGKIKEIYDFANEKHYYREKSQWQLKLQECAGKAFVMEGEGKNFCKIYDVDEGIEIENNNSTLELEEIQGKAYVNVYQNEIWTWFYDVEDIQWISVNVDRKMKIRKVNGKYYFYDETRNKLFDKDGFCLTPDDESCSDN